jgi:hypothetical protein
MAMAAETLEQELQRICDMIRILQIRVDALCQFADPAGGDAVKRAFDAHVDREIGQMTGHRAEAGGPVPAK